MKALTLKQAKFINEFMKTGNATEAAARAYGPTNRNTAHAIGAENLRKPAIRAFLDEKAEKAASIVFELAQSAKSENVRLSASKDILDRAGYGEIKKVSTANVNISTSPANLDKYKTVRNRFEAELFEMLKAG